MTIDLSKTTGTSPPRVITVSADKFAEYTTAMREFRRRHGKIPGNIWPEERALYSAALEKLRAEVLGEQYQPGGGWNVRCDPNAMLICLERDEYMAYRAAIDEFVEEHGNRHDNGGGAATQDAFGELKARLLGDRYFPGCRVLMHVPDALARSVLRLGPVPRFAPTKASPETIALRRKVKGVAVWLTENFPNCFLKGRAKKPLKVGIVKDILDRFHMTSEEADLLREAVGAYRLSYGYRQAYVLGAERINLSGKVVGIVGQGDEEFLNDRLRADLEEQIANEQQEGRAA